MNVRACVGLPKCVRESVRVGVLLRFRACKRARVPGYVCVCERVCVCVCS